MHPKSFISPDWVQADTIQFKKLEKEQNKQTKPEVTKQKTLLNIKEKIIN